MPAQRRHFLFFAFIPAFAAAFASCARPSEESLPGETVSAPSPRQPERGEQTPINPPAGAKLSPPIRIVDAAEFSDGGTTYVRLADSEQNELVLCVSQNLFDGEVPSNTLFLDAVHPDQMTARLPSSDKEIREVIANLKLAINAALPEAEREPPSVAGDPLESFWREQHLVPEAERQSPEAWRLIFAAHALRRIEAKPRHDTLDPAAPAPPDWFAAYDAKRRESHAEERRAMELQRRFLSFYPPEAREVFSETINTLDDDALEKQGRRLASAIGDPVKVANVSCRAFGSLNEEWNSYSGVTRLAIYAMKAVTPNDFTLALPEIADDPSAMLGAGRIYYYLGYGATLPPSVRQEWGPRIAQVILTDDVADNKTMLLGRLEEENHPQMTALLRQVARGEVGSESEFESKPGLSELAYLCLAERGDESVKEEIALRLSKTESPVDRAALEVCLALYGDPSYIKHEHFEILSYNIALAAIKAIEKFEGRHGMDVLVASALEHDWAHVANEAMLAIQRITGQEWVAEDSNLQPRYRKDKAQEWWKENRDEFMKKIESK